MGKHHDVLVGVQGQGAADIVDPVPADRGSATWEFGATLLERDGRYDLRGPFVQGKPGDRFLYLSWCTEHDGAPEMFGRSKLLLAPVGQEVLAEVAAGRTLIARLGLLDDRGKLRMTSIRPPAIEWAAE